MGVNYLLYHLENTHARIPLQVLSPSPSSSSPSNINSINNILSGNLKSIGIDGGIFLHAYTQYTKIDKFSTSLSNSLQYYKNDKFRYKVLSYDNDPSYYYVVDVESSIQKIVEVIIKYIHSICNYFNHHSKNQSTITTSPVACFFAVDGKAPVKKNRMENNYNPDVYSLMSISEKNSFNQQVSVVLEKELSSYKLFGKKYILYFLTNCEIQFNKRGEGEIELFKFAHDISTKFNHDINLRNVIISSDSDVMAMMTLRKDPNIVIVSPPPRKNMIENSNDSFLPYISNLGTLSLALKLNDEQLVHYTILHFIFFGSDYNSGLMTCPTLSKKNLIHLACQKNENASNKVEEMKNSDDDNFSGSGFGILSNINNIGRACKRKKTKDSSFGLPFSLDYLKKILIYEALCSIKYYYTLGTEKEVLQKYSPLLYREADIKKWKALLSFCDE